jgi:hypothetical protein
MAIHWWQSLFGEFVIVTLLVASVAFIAWIIELGTTHQQSHQNKTTTQHQGEAGERASEVESRTGIVKEETNPTEPLKHNAEYNQTKAYAYAYLVTQIIIAMVAAIGIPVAVSSLVTLNESTITANKQFRVSQRAWVGIAGPPKPRMPIQLGVPSQQPCGNKMCPGYIIYNVETTTKNFGNVPATNIRQFYTVATEESRLPDSARLSCQMAFASRSPAYILFPQQRGYPDSSSGQVGSFEAFRNPKPITLNNLWFVGCILYGDTLKPCDTIKACHYTRWCYQAWEMTPDHHVATFRRCPEYNDTDQDEK